VLQPIITCMIEISMWWAIFANSGLEQIGGFGRESYLAYAIWASFVARISSNWMYEFRMVNEIDSGSVNSLLVRPISFYEYYLSQFLGYKFMTTAVSLLVPIAAMALVDLPFHWQRLPATLALIGYYLIFVHTLSFCVASLAFFWNRTLSFTVAKNFIVWILSGEIIPLDLLPAGIKPMILNLPFCNGVFIPVGYLTGRVGSDGLMHGFVTTTVGIVGMSFLARIMWIRGREVYSGTGA
ncbi:MAG: hypothetical protein ABL888_22950, partial [Pirellulaceae bacterium]